MKKNYLSIFVLSLLLSAIIKAQNPFTLTVDSGTYTDLSGANSAIDSMVWDDPDLVFPLGFTYEAFGVSTDSLFSNESVGAILHFNRYDGTSSTPILFTYGSDIMDRGYLNDVSVSPISYLTEGQAGSRIFKAEWKNAGFYNEEDELGTLNYYVNFQLWLYEGSNMMEIRFGPNMVDSFNLVHDFVGPFVGYIDNYDYFTDLWNKWWYLTGHPTNPVVAVTDSLPISGLTATIPEGTIYRFTQELTSAQIFSSKPEVKVYPSIIQNELNVQFTNSDFNGAIIQIFDSFGRFINEQVVSNFIETVNTQNLVAGIYFIHVKTKDGQVVKKIVKK